jgi:hypothetical protein
MPLKGTNQTYEKREKITRDEITGPFYVDRQGSPYDGKFGVTVPLDITLSDGSERTFWANGLLSTQAQENQLAGLTLQIVKRTSSNGREYYTFEEVEV